MQGPPNTNLSFRTDVCRASFRGLAGADGISLRTETHWPRALPAKHQLIKQLRKTDMHIGLYAFAAVG